MKKVIVISAINFDSGGPLAILQDCLKYLQKNIAEEFKIYALVHNKKLFRDLDGIELLEFKKARSSYFYRIYYEYFYFKKLSLRLKPYLWFSLHDITPNVKASIRAVYCHNPAPFYKLNLREVFLDPKFVVFNYFYKWVYQINIQKNNFVVVQQEWLAKEFKKIFSVDRCLVAYPVIDNYHVPLLPRTSPFIQFLFPTFPRVFKNIEIVCEALLLLDEKYKNRCEVLLTIDGTENKYSKWIVDKYKSIESIKFIGLKSRDDVFKLYGLVDCLVFPSKLETWGLPISEFKVLNKPMLVADLEYAHETVGDYNKVKFFDPTNAKILAKMIEDLIDNKLMFDTHIPLNHTGLFAIGWKELFEILLKEYTKNEK